MSDWIVHTERRSPVPAFYRVDVQTADGEIIVGAIAADINWGQRGTPYPGREIVAYRENRNGILPDHPEAVDYNKKQDKPEQVGDVNSNAKGSGARFNSGKPDLSQLDLSLLIPVDTPIPSWVSNVLEGVAEFQHAKLNGVPAEQQTENLTYVLQLIPDWARAAARVFSYGEKKYARYNWMKGMSWNIPIACIGRHALAILEGEEIDDESGEPHAGHIACNIIMLLHYLEHYTEGDDRPCKPE